MLLALLQMSIAGWAAAQHYYAYVACESSDEVNLVHFVAVGDGSTLSQVSASVEVRIPVGVWPSEIEGPHGMAVSPDGKHWFVTMAHGNPFGTLYKYETGSNRLVGKTELGLFPATMVVSPATGLLYAANFNLHGDMEPGTVSVVDPISMTELVQVTTGIMPHGSRLSPSGLSHYSVSMMDGLLHEMDATTFAITRTLKFENTSNRNSQASEIDAGYGTNVSNDAMIDSGTKPTWVVSGPSGRFVYVALNGTDRIAEVSTDSWSVTRELPTGAGPYNAAITSDGNILVVTYKKEGATGIFDLPAGTEIARIKNTRSVSHGVTITPDDRFAFVTVEGVGVQPGSVDIINISTGMVVASVDVGTQAGGIYFWRHSDIPLELGSNR